MRNQKSPGSGNYSSGIRPLPERARERRALRAQLERKGIADKRVLAAIEAVPRHLFMDESIRVHAYEDYALPIGHGQTISQPFIVARMSELLELEQGARVLEVGTGSGYQAAILAALGCYVFSLERVPEIYKRVSLLLKGLGIRTVQVFRTDGTLGYPQAAPYDRIIVTAGGPKIPAPLVKQLDEDGIMLIPVGEQPGRQNLVRLRKRRGQIYTEVLDPVVFVNLVGREGWAQ